MSVTIEVAKETLATHKRQRSRTPGISHEKKMRKHRECDGILELLWSIETAVNNNDIATLKTLIRNPYQYGRG